MTDAVDKLMAELRSACAKEQVVRSHHVIYAQEAIAFLRAELDRVKRERDDATADRDRWYQSSFNATSRAEAAERLAGARVVTEAMVEAGAKAIVACRFEDESEPVTDYDLELSRAALKAAMEAGR